MFSYHFLGCFLFEFPQKLLRVRQHYGYYNSWCVYVCERDQKSSETLDSETGFNKNYSHYNLKGLFRLRKDDIMLCKSIPLWIGKHETTKTSIYNVSLYLPYTVKPEI